MKIYSASQARARFAEVLDFAESGETVVVERGGVRFELEAKPRKRRSKTTTPVFEYVDPAVAAGAWTWTVEEGGLDFVPRPRRG